MEQISKEDFFIIKDLIDNFEKDTLYFKQTLGFNSIYLESLHTETELYAKSILDKLIISRIVLSKRREGLGSSILSELINIANSKGFKQIIIESVCTKEMMNFCLKHNFKVDKNTSILLDELEFGNYILEL